MSCLSQGIVRTSQRSPIFNQPSPVVFQPNVVIQQQEQVMSPSFMQPVASPTSPQVIIRTIFSSVRDAFLQKYKSQFFKIIFNDIYFSY